MADERETVALRIDGKQFRHWGDFIFKWAIDTYATVEFAAPFEPDNRDFRQTFRPFSYKTVYATVGHENLFLGTMVGVHPKVTPERKEVGVTAYALPAVLNDCTPVVDPTVNTVNESATKKLELEFRGLNFEQIAGLLVAPFGVRLDVREIDRVKFEKVAIDSDKKIHDFLVDLAKQRDFVLTSSPEGNLLCWRSVAPGTPVAKLSANASPVTGVESSFQPQEYYSSITGFAPATRKQDGSRHTVKNPWLTDVVRPLSFKLDDMEKGDAPRAAAAKLARMFANAASFTVDVATWRDPAGRLWQPNTTIKLTAPDAMIYRETEFLVREVTLKQTASATTAQLGIVLPGVFSGLPPEHLPWID
jgi:prophage tail gpP-like protein